MGMAVEHRYYGGAAFDGVPDFSAENLKYHSSRQALAAVTSAWLLVSFVRRGWAVVEDWGLARGPAVCEVV